MSRDALCDLVEQVREEWRKAWSDPRFLRLCAACGFGGLLFFSVVQVTQIVLRLP